MISLIQKENNTMDRALNPKTLSTAISTVIRGRVRSPSAMCFAVRDGDNGASGGGVNSGTGVNPLIVAKGDDGETLLHNMAMLGDASLVAALIENGADVNAQSPTGVTPLTRAVSGGHMDVVNALLMRGADPKLGESDKQTALHWLRKSDNAEAIALAIAPKADVNAQDENGMTPAHFAAFRKIDAAISVYANYGMNVNLAAKTGHTPMHAAAISKECPENTAATIAALLKCGANIDAKDNNGDTPLDAAIRMDRTEAIAILAKSGAKRGKDL